MSRFNEVRVTPWELGNAPVGLAPFADIAPLFAPGGRWPLLVQEVLEGVEPWDGDQHIVETVRLDTEAMDYRLYLPVVEARAREQRIWAEHAGHHAKSRGLSPFVKRRWVPKTSWFTVHLVGTVQNPVVVRAYPGDEHPPLPWMASAADCGWERGALVEYWRTHAYPWRDTLARQGSQSPTPPSWYMP